MSEIYRMLGSEREAELERSARRANARTPSSHEPVPERKRQRRYRVLAAAAVIRFWRAASDQAS